MNNALFIWIKNKNKKQAEWKEVSFQWCFVLFVVCRTTMQHWEYCTSPTTWSGELINVFCVVVILLLSWFKMMDVWKQHSLVGLTLRFFFQGWGTGGPGSLLKVHTCLQLGSVNKKHEVNHNLIYLLSANKTKVLPSPPTFNNILCKGLVFRKTCSFFVKCDSHEVSVSVIKINKLFWSVVQ